MNKDKIYLKMAYEMSKMSHCQSHQVACLLVRNGRIISTGINGTPAGKTNCSSVFPDGINPENAMEHRAWSDMHEIHAEQNAIIVAAKNGVAINDTTAYCTLKPCMHCSKMLIAAGVKRVVYMKEYTRSGTSKEEKDLNNFLAMNGLIMNKIELGLE